MASGGPAAPVDVDALRLAAASVKTTFVGVPERPVRAATASTLSDATAVEIVERYTRHGFAILEVGEQRVAANTLLALADSLELGEPFVPPLYQGSRIASERVSLIAATQASTAAEHPHFQTAVGQDLHIDGTLQGIGFIKASLLLCESQAAEGGETILFNASAAFADLMAVDVPAATALTIRGVLIREATIVSDPPSVSVGPAFTVDAGRLVAGYCVDLTDRWEVPVGVSPTDLQRGIDFLARASTPGQPHSAQLMLRPKQTILLDNTRISHGRTAYRYGPRRRCLYRSLHLRHPRARVTLEAIPGNAT